MNCKCGHDMVHTRANGLYWCLNCGRMLDIMNVVADGKFWMEPASIINHEIIKDRAHEHYTEKVR